MSSVTGIELEVAGAGTVGLGAVAAAGLRLIAFLGANVFAPSERVSVTVRVQVHEKPGVLTVDEGRGYGWRFWRNLGLRLLPLSRHNCVT